MLMLSWVARNHREVCCSRLDRVWLSCCHGQVLEHPPHQRKRKNASAKSFRILFMSENLAEFKDHVKLTLAHGAETDAAMMSN